MPTTYQQAEEDVTDLLASLMRRWHPLLASEGVRVGCLMASNPDGVPIKHAGYPALATVKVVSLKDRVTKGYDAELLLDEHEWESMSRESRAALLDHELSHLKLVPVPEAKREPGESIWQRDDLGRPKLKLKLGDWASSDGFAAVVERHGEFAPEYDSLSRCWSRARAALDRSPAEVAE